MCRIVEEYGKEREAEGLKRGVHETAIANAKNLLRMNLGTLEQISQVVSLPLDEELALKEELEREASVVTN
ncbi:MAG: hypothetical protein IJ207_13820 [Treponema sp.]|uniref:hypothetical protein n=1 Tax=Treponema sp. TaxID=166 RepID=UPI0025F39EC4|nr:hypothetical protein [Treponema sp.]MBQ9283252.1 hypothetical protein [Treponema sp.]